MIPWPIWQAEKPDRHLFFRKKFPKCTAYKDTGHSATPTDVAVYSGLRAGLFLDQLSNGIDGLVIKSKAEKIF